MSTRALLRARPPRRGDPSEPDQKAANRKGAEALTGVNAVQVRVDEVSTQPQTDSPAALLTAAEQQPCEPLPQRAQLEDRFGQPLGWIRVRTGPAVAEALDRLDAQAATRGADVFLRDRSAPIDVVAHEVTHALQARGAAPTNAEAGLVSADAAPEHEADRLADTALPLASPVRPAQGLAPQAIALLRQAPGRVEAPTVTPVASAPEPVAEAPHPEPTVAGTTATPTRPEPATPEEPTAEAFTVPPMPEMAVSAEQVAAHEAANAAAQEAMASAGSAPEVLRAFADAPPSLKATQATGLAGRIGEALPTETEQWQSAIPSIEADLAGESGAAPEPVRVDAPGSATVDLEPTAPTPAPLPEIPDPAEPAPFTANDSVAGLFNRFTEPPPDQLADAIEGSLGRVETTDPSVPRTPGPPPPIPLGGETDPARMDGQQAEGRQQAESAQAEAARLVVEGPGPERVQPVAVHESWTLDPVAPPAAPTLEPATGSARFLELGLPPEVHVAFDEQQQQAMRESLTAGITQADEAAAARDTARDEAVATAQEGAATLNQNAQHEQETTVTDAREAIQSQRQATVDAQHAEVTRVEGEAEDRRLHDRGAVDAKVQVEQKSIDDSYSDGERDIADQVREGERKAEAKRVEAERAAEDQSWWDRAVSFVKDAFNALVSAIGDIFDAVRAAVNEALDKLKEFALSVIDRVAGFITDAIAAFGEFLKFAVDALIGDIFPELAAELTSAIDTAVTEAQQAVDTVAETLKSGVNALVEGLRAGINAALDVYQAAISFAVSVVGAALTGDWGAVARMVLEAVLKLVGVDPESFYAFVGRAEETFDIIVDDPLGFLSHLVDALVGGVQGFADRFGEHLMTGIIEWLTGTLGGAGITLPDKFDLLGILDIARQVLGLTWERLRAMAVDLVGEENVARLEYIGSYITTLVTEGWGGLWNRIVADLSGLVDTVFNGIRDFLLEKVVVAMIKKIPVLFGPVGAIVQLVMTAWNLYEFLRDQLSRIAALVTSVVDSIGDIARGILTAAVAKVEQVLGDLVPIALDLLAKLLGLGNLSADVRKVIDRVQESVDKAIDALIARVLALFRGGGAGSDQGSTEPPPEAGTATGAPLTDEERTKLYADIRNHLGTNEVSTAEDARRVLDGVMTGFAPRGLKSVELRPAPGSVAKFEIFARASEGQGVGEVTAVERVKVSDLTSGYITVLIATLNGTQLGPPHRSRGPAEGDHEGHAETWLLTYLTAGVMSMATRGQRNELDVRITRSPCPVCQQRIRARLDQLRDLGFDIRLTVRTASVHRGHTAAGVDVFVDLAMLDDHHVSLEPWDILNDLDDLGISPDLQADLLNDPEAVARLERRVEQVRRILDAINELRVISPISQGAGV